MTIHHPQPARAAGRADGMGLNGQYHEFIASKVLMASPCGFEADIDTPHLFEWQALIVQWALGRGKAAVFADTGLGKTRIQLVWANAVANETQGNVLILAPLGVVGQTSEEARRIGIAVTSCRRQEDAQSGINITNYETLHNFDPSQFTGVVLDESSRIKSFDSKTRQTIIGSFADTPYKLACTATPAPNDHMELGNHAEFVNAMTRAEMLAMFFVHDGGQTSQWRLKGHARNEFWRWVASWAVAVKRPSQLGFDDAGYDLPPLNARHHAVAGKYQNGSLFNVAQGLTEQRKARRASLADRVGKAVDLVRTEPNESWVLWCELNDEADALTAELPEAIEVRGSQSPDEKEHLLKAFSSGAAKVLVSKPSICGHGLNWQHCARTAFIGVGHSFEMYYQAIRRFWRFGQQRPVDVHLIYSESELEVYENLMRKAKEAEHMTEQMVKHMSLYGLSLEARRKDIYNPQERMVIPPWLSTA